MTDDWPDLGERGGRLPAYAERVSTDDGDEVVRCTVCGNTAASLPDLEHECIYQNDLVADGHGLSGTGHDLETHLDDDRGLWIPPELRPFTAPVVFRTPRATIQHFQSDGGDLDPYYGMIDETHFGQPENLSSCVNRHLAPDQVSIKPQGEDEVILPVATEPDPPLRTDGNGAESPDWSQDYVCNGCGKHVTAPVYTDECADCGGRFVEAMPEDLACAGCGAADAGRVMAPTPLRFCDACLHVAEEWYAKAYENLGEWGSQEIDTLLLAMQEELGELTQAYLEATAEGGDPERVDGELDDLAALCLQLAWRLRQRDRDTAADVQGGEADG